MKGLHSFISSSPLEYIQLYSNTTIFGPELEENNLDGFFALLISTHGPRLKGIFIYRLPITMKVLHDVCAGFTNLEHLFVFVKKVDLVSASLRIWPPLLARTRFQDLLGNSLSKATKLQVVHLNSRTVRTGGIESSSSSPQDMLPIVKKCSSTLTQIGCGSCVWQVGLISDIRSGESYRKSGCEEGYRSRKRQEDDDKIGTRSRTTGHGLRSRSSPPFA